MFDILAAPPKRTCVDCDEPAGADGLRCERCADEIAAERLENGRWDDRYTEGEVAA
jgi:hypothetical protein